jgi:hypothetical protein
MAGIAPVISGPLLRPRHSVVGTEPEATLELSRNVARPIYSAHVRFDVGVWMLSHRIVAALSAATVSKHALSIPPARMLESKSTVLHDGGRHSRSCG